MNSELDNSSLPKTISNLLKEGNTVQALTIFLDNKNDHEICNNSWDLIPIITEYLSEECQNNNDGVFKCCEKLIDIIAERSKAEEVLLQFIEEIELASDDIKFLMLLKPLETVLLRVPDKRITTLGWCFNAIKSYLVKIEIPDYVRLEEKERLLLDSDDSAIRIDNLYEMLLNFCQTFVGELIKFNESVATTERKQILSKFLVELLGKPLGFLDMNIYQNVKPRARLMAEKLLKHFFCISYDPFVFLEMRDGDYGSDLIKPNNLSLGVFYYLLLSEEIYFNKIPIIYDSVYILHNSLIFINTLLTQNCQFVVEKGLNLTEALLKKIDSGSLSYLLLDSEHHAKFCKSISNVIVYSESKHIRQKALHNLHKYLWSFEHQGRYLIIINLMSTLSHSGLKGNLTTQYKEMISTEFRSGYTMATISKFYKGQKLFSILNQFTLLKNKEETDIVSDSDQIVSTLNFLRFLLIVDKDDYADSSLYLNHLEEEFLKPLKTGIELSREHYRLKIKQVSEEGEQDDPDCKVSATVSGKNLIEMPKEKKIEIMNLSLTTLDVVDSLLSRVQEYVNDRKNCMVS